MLDAGHTSFYKSKNGSVLYYDFATQDYRPVIVSKNIVSLNVLYNVETM